MQVAGIGRVIFWSGGSLWIGRSLAPSQWHFHHAMQLCIGLSGRPQFRSEKDPTWRFYDAAFIPSDLQHEYEATGKTVAHLFCEPESALGRSLLARFGREAIATLLFSELAQHATALLAAFEAGREDEDLEDLALETLHALGGHVTASEVDPRIRHATGFIRDHLAEPLTLENVATQVGLSPSRFRHVFVAETGISFRAYLLWIRLRRALELGFGGTSWTDAAHATNFSDSAHLSRTTHRMFGFSPTAIRQEIPVTVRPMSA
jgi:AraC-like DNA-binding protein